MSLIVYNEGREPARKIIRRFSSIIRQTGILRRIKEVRFWKRPMSRSKKKLAALRRLEMSRQQKKLEKEGRL